MLGSEAGAGLGRGVVAVGAGAVVDVCAEGLAVVDVVAGPAVVGPAAVVVVGGVVVPAAGAALVVVRTVEDVDPLEDPPQAAGPRDAHSRTAPTTSLRVIVSISDMGLLGVRVMPR
ncbi:MAG TPA: hypothetical protein VGX16_01220 [Solirubrobacteraceae bacterium]|nr:hypothetical protein [Solirubrobacteraceae bacterium]